MPRCAPRHRDIAVCHRDVIAADVRSHANGDPLFRWLLDVSDGALWNLLQMWGERFDSLEVICDESNPLYEVRDHFDVMIGRSDRRYVKVEDRLQPLIFNLSGPLQFKSSRSHTGIQVADLFATTATCGCKNLASKELAPLEQLIVPAIHNAVLPDLVELVLESPRAFANRLVLFELVDRSLKRENLFDGMPEFIAAAVETHAGFLRSPHRSGIVAG